MQPETIPAPKALRQALSHFVTGVAVVTTTTAAGEAIGMTINSFTSISLDPPLVAWSIATRSGLHRVFAEATHFAINILGAHQRDLCSTFARPGRDRFAGVPTRHGKDGVPLIDNAIAHFECRKAQIIEAGDHHILIGEIGDFAHSDEPPLVFCKGQLHDWSSAVPHH